MWYLFYIKKGNIALANQQNLPSRPTNVNDPRGNPYTPWYRLDDHWDLDHVHIRGESLEHAFEKANSILCHPDFLNYLPP